MQPARYFAASYAGEHVAGTEFVIGAAFVAWGASAIDVIGGLALGNLLAVLTWRFVCAPIAVDTRLTLYAYLEKIAGPAFIKFYSVINGVMFCILAGAMITVSASAVRIPFNIAPQTHWLPSDPAFVMVALAVGAVVVVFAVLGFRRLAQFAGAVVPWMIVMFAVGGVAALPVLAQAIGGQGAALTPDMIWTIANTRIWVEAGAEGLGFWHVAAFAWIANLAMHGALGDMTLLRYAKKARYGYFSALGMFLGHFMAWIAAGAMGAASATLLGVGVQALDAGEVAYQALGWAGVVAVIIAGWTTSNPTLYRAGLAFQSLNPAWGRARVTAIVGVITTVIACFPFVFTGLLGFVGVMGLTLAPVGAIIVAEHWLFARLGMTRYWSFYGGSSLNPAALLAWAAALAAAWFLYGLGVHLFFLLIPVWLTATAAYILLARLFGAGRGHAGAADHERLEAARKQAERDYLHASAAGASERAKDSALLLVTRWVSALALAYLIVRTGVFVTSTEGLFAERFDAFQHDLVAPTAVYFVAAALSTALREKKSSA